MIKVNANTGKVGKRIKTALDEGYAEIINKGGTGSGKTYDTIIIIMWLLFTQVKNKVATVISESKPHLDIGALRYAKQMTLDLREKGVLQYNEAKSFFIFPNNNILEFYSADRIEKAIGARRYLLFGNEINSLRHDIWDELTRRSQIVIADFNPTNKFWLEEKYLPYCRNPIVMKSNYLDNIYLPDYEREKIEKRIALDENFKRIHVDCKYGLSEGLVFSNYEQIDELPPDLKYTYGMDFGWTAPSTMVKVGIRDDSIYVDEMFYKPMMNEANFKIELQGLSRSDEIYADNSDKRMIDYLANNLGFNIRAVRKKKGSVEFGVGYLQAKTIYITKRSVNIIREFRNYGHVIDRTGKPVKGKYMGDDHAIDAIRYAIENRIGQTNSGIVTIHF